MKIDSMIRAFITIMTCLFLVIGVFATVIDTNTEMKGPDSEELEQPSQPIVTPEPEESAGEAKPFFESEESGTLQEGEVIPEEQEVSASFDEIIEHEIYAGPYYIIEDEQGYDRINMLKPGYGLMDSPGDPQLPEKILEFEVSDDIDWTSVELTVEIQESETLHETYNIAPSPPVWVGDSQDGYEDWGVGKHISQGKNMNVYGEDGNFPEQSIELLPYTERKEQTEFGFERVKYERIAYRPFLYNPASGELTFVPQANVQITYNCLSQGPQPLGPGTYDYVIITTNDVVANSDRLDNFINLKELTHDVLVVTEDDFDGLTAQPPNERPDKIRKWLIDNEGPLGIDYVLLIGDPDPDDPKDPGDHVGDLPMKYCWPNFLSWKAYESPAYNGCPTDYYYADLTGDWDLDGDQMYGELVDITNDKSPHSSIGENTFSAEWTGQVMCDFSEEYKFHTLSDDGVELLIDGTPVITDLGTKTWPVNNYAILTMTAGKHDITLKYHEHTHHGIIKLYWETNSSDNVKKEIIPDDHLYDLLDVVGGLNATYYNNEDFTGSTHSRKDSVIDFFWGTGDRGPSGPDTGADVFVGRIPVYDDDYEQLDDILEKIIIYETDPGDISWRESALLAMAPLADNTPAWHYGEEVKDYILPSGWSYYRLYMDDYSSTGGPTPEDWPVSKAKVATEWGNGYGIVTWWTHGGTGGAKHIFDTNYIGNLDDSKPSIVFQSTCMNGYPESTNNLAYALLKHGAVATFASTRVSSGSRGNWTYDATSTANPNFGYKTIDHLITDGYTTGVSLYEAKDSVPSLIMTMNGMNYNLYGDPDCYFLSTLPIAPPVADIGGPYLGDEGSPITFDASASYDPDSYPAPLEYRWDFDNDGEWDTSWSSDPTATFTWTDDYSGDVVVEVSDSVLTDSDSTTVTVNNVAPSIVEFGPFSGDEPYLVSITTDASDPGSDDLTFTWEFYLGPTIITTYFNDGMGPDPGDSYLGGDYPFTATDSVSHEYGDNGNYTVTLTVEDDNGGVTVYSSYVIVDNVAPTIEDVEAYILVNFTLRAAGEKWHNVQMYIKADGGDIAFTEVVRYPGSPDDQSVTLYEVKCDVTKVIEVHVFYTPSDDPINGQPNGATPVWVTLDFEDGEDNRLHHTCNVKHPDTWEWIIGVNQYFVGHNITFEGTASDPGSDDLTFTWDWDDGTADTETIYYNDGVGPDPYPSPDGVYPVSVLDVQKHMFTTNDNFNVELTVEDDDGDEDSVVLIIIMV